MARIDDLLTMALTNLSAKPEDGLREDKKGYSERLSSAVARAFAEDLRGRGAKLARPGLPGETGKSGAERRIAGGVGGKKVDVTWSTEEAGLLLGISVKSINFRDRKSGTFQKNLTNRRGDMLFEAVTLHRRFPFAVIVGLLFLDEGAETDNHREEPNKKSRRRSTFLNAHARLRLFNN